jgi:hypothetical protein
MHVLSEAVEQSLSSRLCLANRIHGSTDPFRELYFFFSNETNPINQANYQYVSKNLNQHPVEKDDPHSSTGVNKPYILQLDILDENPHQ